MSLVWKKAMLIAPLLFIINLSTGARSDVSHNALGHKFEMEDMEPTGGERASSVALRWLNTSNYKYLRLDLRDIGDFAEYTTPNIPADTYDILMGYISGIDFGVVQTFIDGRQIGQEIDMYDEDRNGLLKVASLGKLSFQEQGAKIVRFVAVGKSKSSNGYLAGIDYIEFRKRPSSYLEVVKGFADTFINDAKDSYGDKQTGMFLSIMNRKPLHAYEQELPPNPGGIRWGDRGSTHGSNMDLMQNIYRALYALSEITGNPDYASAANRGLKGFIDLAQSPVTGLMAWGEHICFDLLKDDVGYSTNSRDGGRYYQLFAENGTLCWSVDDAVNKTQVKYPINAGEWYHAIGVREMEDEIRLYVDGKLAVTAKDQTGRNIASDRPLYIGDRFSGQRAFIGSIDEASIYNRALSKDEVLQSYSAYTDGRRANIAGKDPVSCWTFDEVDIDGKNIRDIRGNNHGTISGDPKIVDGKIGNALEFNGNDHIVCGADPSVLLSDTDFSVVVCFNADTTGPGLPDKTGYLMGTYSEGGEEVKYHEMKRKMVFWDYYYRVNPQAALKFARGLWEHQINDQETGNFSRHARYDQHGTGKGYDFPKEAGYMIELWAYAYRDSQDEVFLKAIEVLSHRYVDKLNQIYQIEHDTMRPEQSSPIENLSLAICSTEAARWIPAGELREELETLAASIDRGFHLLKHDLDGPGFIYICHTETGKPYPRESHQAVGYAVDWEMKYGRKTNAQVALLCYTRMNQLPEGEIRDKYRNVILATADRYMDSDPDVNSIDIWPGEYGMAVFLQIVAYKMTGSEKYLHRARHFADEAVLYYFDPDSYLPKASNWARHYECITRCDTMILSLLALCALENELAVEIPISDIDR